MLSSPLLSKLFKYIKEEFWTTHTRAGRFVIFSAVRRNSLSNDEPVEFFLPITRLSFFFRMHRCVGDRVPVSFFFASRRALLIFFAGSTAVEASFARLLRCSHKKQFQYRKPIRQHGLNVILFLKVLHFFYG